jgi:Electron transfer DM13
MRLEVMRLRWLVGGLVVVMLAVGGYWFEPWRLFTTREVDERLPVAAPADQPTAGPSAPSGPVDLLRGRFVNHEHGTSGRVRVVSQPDGSRLLAIEDLDTSDGPDLRVWLTDAEVSEDGWRVFDDGRYVDLGELRGNKGNLVYELPRDVDLADYQSVSIWCERFSVSFGAAALVPA